MKGQYEIDFKKIDWGELHTYVVSSQVVTAESM
jgi:hypothetical protein